MRRTLIALVFGGMFMTALPAFAQLGGSFDSALTIISTPSNPAPHSSVKLTAESPLLDLQDSDIAWTVNGKPAGSGQSITITLGALGEETDVAVSVSGPSGNDSASLALVPTSIDLLWEASSYVPPFYEGRALPTSGSMVRVLAVPHFESSSGSAVSPTTIDFTWKLNGAVQQGQSGIGESSAVFPAAVLYGSDVIEVDARTPDGTLSGQGQISIRTGDPQLVLYEDSPLFGVMYYQAIPQSALASEAETSFAAVPYFADAVSANDQTLAYAWTVNGSPVQSDAQDPSEITINAQSAGTATIGLTVSKSSDAFFGAHGTWAISFSSAAALQQHNNVFDSSQ